MILPYQINKSLTYDAMRFGTVMSPCRGLTVNFNINLDLLKFQFD